MADERFSFRWGIPLLDEGYTTIPNFMFRHYAEAGVTRAEFLVILHLASYHYESANGQASPSLRAVAKEMGYSSRHGLQKQLRSLEEKEMLARHYRSGDTSVYDFGGFSHKVLQVYLAAREAEEGGKLELAGGLTEVSRGGKLELAQRTKEEQHQEEHDGVISEELVKKLITFGVHEGQAKKWASARPAEMVLGWIEYVQRNGHGLSNAPGFLVSKLKAGEEPPAMERPEDDPRRYLEGPYSHLIQH